jgi:diguanylate cyclase (GGDEF)-like protein
MLFAIMQVNAWLIPLVLVPLYAVSTMSRLWYERTQRYLVDTLTGLPNWTAMAGETDRELAEVALADHTNAGFGRTDGLIALLVIDLHQFHLINEALGYSVADRLLVAVGQRLCQHATPDTAVCRLKGDEFGLLRRHLANEDEVQAVADAVRVQLAEPFTIDRQQLVLDVCIGIAIYPQHGENFHVLAQHADTALQRAKVAPPGLAVFQPGTESSAAQRWALLEELRRVLDQASGTEIVPYYQPQVDLANGEVVAVEALLRWQHPIRGLVSTDEVIRAAEYSPLMQKITRRMIGQVLDQLRSWRSDGLTIRASVNVSMHDLYGRDFVAWLRRQLHGHDISPASLQLEITESALMTQPSNVLDSLRSLRQTGVGIALDDFGTGFSSLQHLRRLPLTEIKIDRSFVQSMVDDDDAQAIVRAIIDLAASLDLRVVAEGVEDERTLQRLLANSCRIAQGWYYAKARPGADFRQWLADHDAKVARSIR